MKVVDDKLKIIDDVPNSAVEMAVKEKVIVDNWQLKLLETNYSFHQFLKKVQRQDRIVEEVKLVLKPAYNDRKITKEAYKEILRKTVPKVGFILMTDFINSNFVSTFTDLPQQTRGNKSIQNWEASVRVYQEAWACQEESQEEGKAE